MFVLMFSSLIKGEFCCVWLCVPSPGPRDVTRSPAGLFAGRCQKRCAHSLWPGFRRCSGSPVRLGGGQGHLCPQQRTLAVA